MTKEKQKNIFNIASNQNFFNSLYNWIENNFIQNASELKILFPGQRSAREFNDLYLNHKLKDLDINKSIILPKIKAISSLSYEDFFDFLPNDEVKKIIDEILEIKVIDDFDYLFLLSQEVQKTVIFGNKILPSQAFNIAVSLKNLFDEIENNQVDLTNLNKIDDSNLSLHRQLNLEFLQSLYVGIKNSLIKKNIYFPSAFHNLVVDKFCQSIEKFGLKSPIIIAGSSGSLSAGKKLIKSISSQSNGFVFLYGFDQNNSGYQEVNPQFILNELIDFVKVDRNKIINLSDNKFTLSCKIRLNFLSFLTLPQENTINWQKDFLGKADVKKDIENNFILIEAKNNLEEATLISFVIFDAITEGKNCAVISNNDKLTEFLKYKLRSLNLDYNDARNIGILNSGLINFIISILEFLCDDFSSISLSSIFKNPIFYNHKEKKLIYKLENEVLRQDRVNDEILGVRSKLEDLNDKNLTNFFEEFYKKLEPLQNLNSEVLLSNYITSLIEVIEKLSAKSWEILLENENAQSEIYEFFEILKKQNEFTVSKNDFLALFKNFAKQVSYFEKSNSSSKIQILSTIEARLLNYDLMIIASLNEGDFPKIETENWLGKKIRKDLGVDKKLRRIGQNCYDFCNYLSNNKVVLTRSLTFQDSPTSPSPFLLKFETLCKKLEINLNKGDDYFKFYKAANISRNIKISQPQPKPELKNRTKKLAVTDISKMLSDPYSIYAKRILKLKELKNFDFEPSYAEFGSFVHKALEEFVKKPQDNFLNEAKIIFKNYFLSQRSELIWWPKFEEIFEYFLQQEKQLEVVRNYTELTSTLKIKDVTITGKIDRVTTNKDNSVAIYDYKTGQIPSDKSVFLGIEPQLTISALMLIEGALEKEIENLPSELISSLNYWKVSGSNESKIKNVCDDNEKIKILISSAKSGLEKLVEYFNNENSPYISAPNPDKYIYNEYSHLARIKEWI